MGESEIKAKLDALKATIQRAFDSRSRFWFYTLLACAYALYDEWRAVRHSKKNAKNEAMLDPVQSRARFRAQSRSPEAGPWILAERRCPVMAKRPYQRDRARGRSPPGTRRAGRSSRGPRRSVRVQAAHASNAISPFIPAPSTAEVCHSHDARRRDAHTMPRSTPAWRPARVPKRCRARAEETMRPACESL
jgi:hypothetical protein